MDVLEAAGRAGKRLGPKERESSAYHGPMSITCPGTATRPRTAIVLPRYLTSLTMTFGKHR